MFDHFFVCLSSYCKQKNTKQKITTLEFNKKSKKHFGV